MRDIKFRVWDNQHNKMTQCFDLNDFANDQDGEFGNGEFSIGWYDYKRSPPMVDNIIMQYTGLKDKNGKEIYEGDIIQYGSYKAAEVIYSDYLTSFCLKFNDGKDGIYARALGQCNKRLKYIDEDVEILGNIYEHPELLKA